MTNQAVLRSTRPRFRPSNHAAATMSTFATLTAISPAPHSLTTCSLIFANLPVSSTLNIRVTDPSGGIATIPATSDSSGALTVSFVPQTPGTYHLDSPCQVTFTAASTV